MTVALMDALWVLSVGMAMNESRRGDTGREARKKKRRGARQGEGASGEKQICPLLCSDLVCTAPHCCAQTVK